MKLIYKPHWVTELTIGKKKALSSRGKIKIDKGILSNENNETGYQTSKEC